MTQYTSCADPTESAARKERLRQAEAQGQVEESAVQMVKASIVRENAEAESLAAVGVSSQECIPTISRLGLVNVELMR
ncbi:BnaA10g03310D [Brassica napus]|uniref:BnaA10g03310D protein n=1 Tax=Brassica napus TaxID=3708 RepID=A0A078I9M4_BRANA|nr:BnaA10g03310D [Brassica napus]